MTSFFPFSSSRTRATAIRVALFFVVVFPSFAQDNGDTQVAPWKLVTLVEDPVEKDGEYVRYKKDNIPLAPGKVATIGGGSRLEFAGLGGEILRVGHNSEFSPISDGTLEFRKGSFLLHIPKGGKPHKLVSPGVHVDLEAEGTFLGEAMPLGGLKLIPLVGKGIVKFEETATSHGLTPGQVEFFLPEGKRPPSVEVYLPLLVASCPLINAFEEELPEMDKLIHRARIQAKLVKRRTGAFVYDAVDEKNVRFLVPTAKDKEVEAEPRFRIPKLRNLFKKTSEPED